MLCYEGEEERREKRMGMRCGAVRCASRRKDAYGNQIDTRLASWVELESVGIEQGMKGGESDGLEGFRGHWSEDGRA